jgi:hypothetical protein
VIYKGGDLKLEFGNLRTRVRPGGGGCKPNHGRQDSEVNSRRTAAERIVAETGKLSETGGCRCEKECAIIFA